MGLHSCFVSHILCTKDPLFVLASPSYWIGVTEPRLSCCLDCFNLQEKRCRENEKKGEKKELTQLRPYIGASFCVPGHVFTGTCSAFIRLTASPLSILRYISGILATRYGLKRRNKTCANMIILPSMLAKFNSSMYSYSYWTTRSKGHCKCQRWFTTSRRCRWKCRNCWGLEWRGSTSWRAYLYHQLNKGMKEWNFLNFSPPKMRLFDQICQHCDKLCQFVSSLSLDIFVYAVVQTLCLDSNLDTKGKNSATS